MLATNQGHPEEAARTLLSYADRDLNSPVSMAQRINAAELVTLIMLAGHEDDALEILAQYAQRNGKGTKSKIPDNEINDINSITALRKNHFTRSLWEQLSTALQLHSATERIFLLTHLLNCMKTKNSEKMPSKLKYEIILPCLNEPEWADIPQKKINLCEIIISSDEAQKCSRGENEMEYRQLAMLQKAGILRTTFKEAEAAEIFNELNKSKSNKRLEALQLFRLGLRIHHEKDARAIALACTSGPELDGMAATCIQSGSDEMAKLCLDRARQFATGILESTDLKINSAIYYLNRNDVSAPRQELSSLDLNALDSSALPEANRDSLVYAIVLAMADAGMCDEATTLAKKYGRWK